MRSKGLLNLASSSLPGRCREAASETRAQRVRGRGPPRRHDPPLRLRRGRLLRRAAPRFRTGLQGTARPSVKYQIRFISRFLLTSSLERANEPAYFVVGTLTDAREQDVIDSGWIADDEVTESVGGESGYSSVRRHGNDGSKSIG